MNTDTGTSQAEQLSRRAWGMLLVLCGALFLDALDVSMVGVALPSIRTDLDMSTSSLQWVVSAYVLGYGGFLLLGGRAADLLGRRRVFLIALAVFLVASGLGGLANDGTVLIVTRFVKGVSAAFTAPAGLSIITTTFAEGPARNKALSIYTATGATGFSLGLVFGGLLTELGWRWTFFLPVPIALVALLAGLRLVPKQPRVVGPRGSFDVAGAISLTAGMLLLVYTLVEAPTKGWDSARTLGSLALVVLILGAFVLREQTAKALHAAAARLVAARDGPGDLPRRCPRCVAGASHSAADLPLRRHSANPARCAVDGGRVLALRPDRRELGLSDGRPADRAARRARLRIGVRPTQRRRDDRRRAE
jgi:MFS family permease